MIKIKNIYIKGIAMSMMLILGFTNCSDLSESNLGVVAPHTYFDDEATIEAAISGVYKEFHKRWGGIGYWGPHLNSASDIQQSGVAWAYLRDFETLTVKPDNNALAQIWIRLYSVVKAANLAVNGIIEIGDELEQEKRDEYLSQVYFGRALAYFYLVRWWGDVPLFTEENQGDVENITRTSISDVYNQIVRDLVFAEKHLKVSNTGMPGLPTAGAAKTLLAKVYLTMAGWPLKQTEKYADAAAKAKEVIDSGVYELVEDINDLWLVANNGHKEEVFAYMYLSTNEGGTMNSSWQVKGQTTPTELGYGWSEYYSKQEFFNDFPDGVRKESTFITEANGLDYTEWSVPFPHCNKFQDLSNGNKKSSSFNFPLYRYAEVLLIYAEAQNLANNGPSTEAYAAVNEVRNRAGLGNLPEGLGSQEFDDAVMDERKWELGFEQKRWFDLQRKELVLVANQDVPGVTVDDMLFPIPQREIDVVGSSLVQNPGY